MRKRANFHQAVLSGSIAAAAAILSGSMAYGQTNLLLDPGFEGGINGAPTASTNNDIPMSTSGPWSGWNNWVGPYSGFYTTAVSRSGTQSGKTFSTQNGGVYQSAAVTAGDSFTASGWFDNYANDALVSSDTDEVVITFYGGANGTGLNLGAVASPTNLNASSPTNTWTQLSVQAQAPAGAVSATWLAFFQDPDYSGGALYVDDASLLDTSWNGGGTDTNWSTNNNWGGVAPGQYAPLVFAGTKGLNNNNDFTAGTPFYGITFQPSAGSFNLGGNEANLASDVVNNSANSQTIGIGLGLQQNTNFNAAAGNITVTGAIAGAFSLTKLGSHTLTLSGPNAYTGGTDVSAGTLVVGANGALPVGPVAITGGTLQLGTGTGLAEVTSLAVSGNGTVDITNNHLIINYAGEGDPIASIASLINSGYAGGSWTGTGITSSAAQANAGSYGIGYADSADAGNPAGLAASTIEVMYTLLGDANLDGKVNSIDFAILASDFNKAVVGSSGWDQGDFNYDGHINSIDFADLAGNFNKGASQADVAALEAFASANGLLADVPEPASISLLAVGGVSLLSRRARRRTRSA